MLQLIDFETWRDDEGNSMEDLFQVNDPDNYNEDWRYGIPNSCRGQWRQVMVGEDSWLYAPLAVFHKFVNLEKVNHPNYLVGQCNNIPFHCRPKIS